MANTVMQKPVNLGVSEGRMSVEMFDKWIPKFQYPKPYIDLSTFIKH